MSQLKDVAARAGVSVATVSLVLNNKPGVGEETRENVMRAVQELGYTRTRSRSSVPSRQKECCVQFVLYKKHGQVVADTPFFAELLEGVETQARRHGMKLLITYLYEQQGIEEQLQRIMDAGCNGMILLATEMEEQDLQAFQDCGIPLIVVDNTMNDIDVDTVLMNNVQGARDAVLHLAAQGLTRIGHLRSNVVISNFTERCIGYMQALQETGLTEASAPYTFDVGSTAESAYQDMKALLASGRELPQGFYADNDVVALGAMRALLEAGKRIPEDVALIGFDDVPMCELSVPTLSSMRVDKSYIGRAAVDCLAHRIEDPGHPAVRVVVRTTLMARGSTKVN